MKRALTVRAVETISPGKIRKETPDAYLPGLYLLTQPSGAKSWCVRYRSAGQTRKHTLGPYPAIDLKSARALGAKALRAAAEGRDPSREKARARSAKPDTVETVTAQFIERHAKRSTRASSAKETERLLRTHVLPRWGHRPVTDITRRDVLDMLDRVVDRGAPISANRVFSVTRKFFRWCIDRDIIDASPCAGMRPPTVEHTRDRVLTDAELTLVWQAADKIGWPFGTIVKLLMLTGQRKSEVTGMQWAELDLKGALWVLPADRVKNGQRHEVPLSGAVLAIIKDAPRIEGGEHVFTTNGTAPPSGFSKWKRRLDGLLPPDMPQWTLHDLRRSAASGMARLGISLPVVEKILNHVSGSFSGVAGIYQRHDFAAEKRAALEAWNAKVIALSKGAP
jgi:integrase